VRVLVERHVSARAWRRVRGLVVAPDATGRFAASLALRTPGIYRLTATTRADATNAAGSSRTVVVRVLARG
jgi:hypothetical protein